MRDESERERMGAEIETQESERITEKKETKREDEREIETE